MNPQHLRFFFMPEGKSAYKKTAESTLVRLDGEHALSRWAKTAMDL